MSGTGYTLVSLPNQKQPSEQVRNGRWKSESFQKRETHTRELRKFSTCLISLPNPAPAPECEGWHTTRTES